MQSERLTFGERITSVSAIVLLISMFLDWFVIEIPDTTGTVFFIDGTGQNAWQSLNFIPIVLVATVCAALVLPGLRLSGAIGRSLPLANWPVAALGLLSILLIVYRIVDPPGVDGTFEGFMGSVTAHRAVQYGIFIGLLGAVGISFGAYRAAVEAAGGSRGGMSSENVTG